MNFLTPTILDIFDIFIVAFILYRIILLVRGTKTYQIVWGIILLLILYVVARLFNLVLLGSVINIIKDFWVIAIVILFQPEIRAALIKFGRKPFLRSLFPQKQVTHFTELLNALRTMSYYKLGGLFVLVREIGVDDYLATGELIHADISEKLILTIFNTKTPLHDGAMVLANNEIVAAKVILPLTTQDRYTKKHGTRHQAGIGISEQTDAFVIIVSEETGHISTATNGKITENIPIDVLSQVLHDEMQQ